jgi:hypothetical protein
VYGFHVFTLHILALSETLRLLMGGVTFAVANIVRGGQLIGPQEQRVNNSNDSHSQIDTDQLNTNPVMFLWNWVDEKNFISQKRERRMG